MKAFLWDWRYIIAVVIIILIAALINWEHTKEFILEAMLDAKELAKEGILNTGKQQEDWVVKMIYKLLPKFITFFLKEDSVRKLVRHFYNKSMDYLDDGKMNNSFKNKNNSIEK